MKTNPVLGVALLIFAFLIAAFAYAHYRLFTATHLRVPSSTDQTFDSVNLPAVPVEFITDDGILIKGSYVPHPTSKAVVILVHGYSLPTGGKNKMIPHARYLYEAGYSTLSIDLRAFGESQGNLTTFGTKEWRDIKAAYHYLKSLPETQDQLIGYMGISMGAASVLNNVGVTGEGDFVIAVVPYKSLSSLFAYQTRAEGFPIFFVPLLEISAQLQLDPHFKDFSPEKNISHINVPLLIIGAHQDTTVDPEDSQVLYEAARQPKELWMAESGHDVYYELPQEFQDHVVTFLTKHIEGAVNGQNPD